MSCCTNRTSVCVLSVCRWFSRPRLWEDAFLRTWPRANGTVCRCASHQVWCSGSPTTAGLFVLLRPATTQQVKSRCVCVLVPSTSKLLITQPTEVVSIPVASLAWRCTHLKGHYAVCHSDNGHYPAVEVKRELVLELFSFHFLTTSTS